MKKPGLQKDLIKGRTALLQFSEDVIKHTMAS